MPRIRRHERERERAGVGRLCPSLLQQDVLERLCVAARDLSFINLSQFVSSSSMASAAEPFISQRDLSQPERVFFSEAVYGSISLVSLDASHVPNGNESAPWDSRKERVALSSSHIQSVFRRSFTAGGGVHPSVQSRLMFILQISVRHRGERGSVRPSSFILVPYQAPFKRLFVTHFVLVHSYLHISTAFTFHLAVTQFVTAFVH